MLNGGIETKGKKKDLDKLEQQTQTNKMKC